MVSVMQWRHLRWSAVLLIVSIIAFITENFISKQWLLPVIIDVLDYLVLLVVFIDLYVRFQNHEIAKEKLSSRLVAGFLLLLYFAVFIDLKFFQGNSLAAIGNFHALIILRSVYIYLSAIQRDDRAKRYLLRLFQRPAQTMALSFAIIIFIGSLILNMPFTQTQQGVSYLDALFFATSATCVTGLATLNITENFTLAGQFIIILLVQIGGLGILMLSYVIMSGRRSVSVHGKALLAYMLSDDDLHNITRFAQNIVKTTFFIELLGAIFLFLGMGQDIGYNIKTAYYSTFHAISAYCNAGFSLFTNSFENFKGNTTVNITLMVLITCGSLGFAVIINLYRYVRQSIKHLINPDNHRREVLSLNSKIVLKGSVILVIGGFILFYLLEHRGVIEGFSLKEQYLSALFQSVTLRTAGLNTVNMTALHLPTILVMCLWMFIGGASGGIAGGVKITTIAVAKAGFVSFFQNRSKAQLGPYSISNDDVRKAYMVIIFGVMTIALSTFILTLTEEFSLSQLFFESISAFSTTGLSIGITAKFSALGKLILILLMFVGRIGPLTIFVIVQEGSSKKGKKTPEYPLGQVLIG